MIGSPSYEALQKNKFVKYWNTEKKKNIYIYIYIEIRDKTNGYSIGFKGTFTRGQPFKFDEGGVGELALLIYVDTRLFNSLHLFFPVHVGLHLFFLWNHTSPFKKKTVGLFRDFLIEKFLPLLLRKKKVFGVFCTSSSLLAIWFRCTVLSFYSACQIFFQVRFISVLSLLAKFCRQNSFTWSFNFPHALEGYCWLFVC